MKHGIPDSEWDFWRSKHPDLTDTEFIEWYRQKKFEKMTDNLERILRARFEHGIPDYEWNFWRSKHPDLTDTEFIEWYRQKNFKKITDTVKRFVRARFDLDKSSGLDFNERLFNATIGSEAVADLDRLHLSGVFTLHLIFEVVEAAVHEAQRVRGGKPKGPSKPDMAVALYKNEYQAKVRAGQLARYTAVDKIAKAVGVKVGTARNYLRGRK